MTSSRFTPNLSLWPLAVALPVSVAIFGAATWPFRKLARWARGLFFTPLHKAPHGHADDPDEQSECMPSHAFRRSFASTAAHETHAWPKHSLSSPWPAGGPPWSPQDEPETTVLTMVPDLAPDLEALPDDQEPFETDDEFIESAAHLLPAAATETDLPAWVIDDPDCLNGHDNTTDEVESMLQRALTPDLLAAMDKEAGR